MKKMENLSTMLSDWKYWFASAVVYGLAFWGLFSLIQATHSDPYRDCRVITKERLEKLLSERKTALGSNEWGIYTARIFENLEILESCEESERQ